MAGALDGMRIVDFGQYIAGPLAGMLLADQGADVVRIEPPGGPRWQTPANATWNRGKRRLTLDLKEPSDLEAARQLLAGADALIEGFRPGVMERLGLGPDAVAELNPRLVYCSLPGFASDDPRAGVAAWEGVVGAATGTYKMIHGGGTHDRPVYTAIPIPSAFAAFLGATSITMALNGRGRSGLGQHIEVPLFDATFTAIGSRGLLFDDPTRRPPPRAAGWIRQYECADGRWVQFHAATPRFIEQFIDAASTDDTDIRAWREERLHDSEWVGARPELDAELIGRMEALFKTRSAQEWEDLVNAAGTPTAICRETREWFEHPHARAAQMIVEVDDPQLGPMKQPGLNTRLSRTPGGVRGPRPVADADRASLLSEWSEASPWASVGAADSPTLAGALEGVKVLDLCIILAGPTCGRTLAEFGADVVKIDDPNREGGIRLHNDVNRGKRSILLNLKSEEGLEAFWQLVEQADVLVQNYREGVAGKLGIDYESVRRRNPAIVYVSLNAYGHGGPWDDRPGWEQLAQAATGMQMRFGDDRPALQPFPINDYGTGLMGAYGVALALLERQRSGEGQHVRTALAYTGCTLQSPFFQDYQGKRWDEPRGQQTLGSGPLHSLYQTSDGWLFLGARDADLPRLEAAGLAGAAGRDPEALHDFLAERLRGDTTESWVARLTEAGVGASDVTTVDALMEDPWVIGHGLSITREHEQLGLVRTTGPSPRLSRTPVVPGRPATPPGSDGPAVFTAFGLGDEVDRLVRSGALVTEGVPAR